ncbi:MAG: hypothetical protein LBS69_11855 [Prevotellaceae bacterium]|jgi:hypothetical protein|nr:hypothetical protein [Prevotellaceae bacterium]
MKKILFLFSLLIATLTVNAQGGDTRKRLYTKDGVCYTITPALSKWAKEEVRLAKKYDSYIRNGMDIIRIGDYEKAIFHFLELPQVDYKKSMRFFNMKDGIHTFYDRMVAFICYLKGDYESAIRIFDDNSRNGYEYIDFTTKYLFNDKLGIRFHEAYITCSAIEGNVKALYERSCINRSRDYDIDFGLYNKDYEDDESIESVMQVLYLKLYALSQNPEYWKDAIANHEKNIDKGENISAFNQYIYYRCLEKVAYKASDPEEQKTYLKFSENAFKKLQETGQTEIEEIISNKMVAASINYMEGKWYFENKFYDKAEKCFIEYEKVFPFNQMPVLYRGEIVEKRGYYKDAFDIYNSIKRSYFNETQVESVKKSIVRNLELHENLLKKLNMNEVEAEKEKESLGSWKSFYDKYR